MSIATTSPDSVTELYANHHGWLQGWLRRQLGNAFDAADIAQDVFIRILSRQQPLKLAEPRAYLSSIARGLVIDHWRRRELEEVWLETLACMPEAAGPSPESRLLILEALVAIDRLLDSLKPPVRQAFLLAQLEGLTCPQIAEKLGVSRATVERYIAKALHHCYEVQYTS